MSDVNYCKLYGKLFKNWVGDIQNLRRYNVEFGAPICREEGRIRVGDRASIGLGMSMILECTTGVREASIHSHIVSDKASLQDHVSSILSGDTRQCIIYNRDDKEHIKCYTYEKHPKEELAKDVIEMNRVIHREKEKYNKLMDEYDKKYFLCDEEL